MIIMMEKGYILNRKTSGHIRIQLSLTVAVIYESYQSES